MDVAPFDMNHATVIIDGKPIPLIGIPLDATEDKCDDCGKLTHISQLHWHNGQLICQRCLMTEFVPVKFVG